MAPAKSTKIKESQEQKEGTKNLSDIVEVHEYLENLNYNKDKYLGLIFATLEDPPNMDKIPFSFLVFMPGFHLTYHA